MQINLAEYDEIDTFGIRDFIPNVGDIVYHPSDDSIQIIITESTDLIQEEFYPLLWNFGCILLRKKDT
jgi:hypothetical protein